MPEEENEITFMRHALDKMEEAISLLKEIVVRQEEAGKASDRRMGVAEDQLKEFYRQFEPIKNHVTLVNNLCKVFTGLSAIAASFFTLYRMIHTS